MRRFPQHLSIASKSLSNPHLQTFLIVVSLIASTLGLVGAASARSFTLAWEPVLNDPNIAGYEVHVGLASGEYQKRWFAARNGAATSQLVIDEDQLALTGATMDSEYYFAVRSLAHDRSGTSRFSNEIKVALHGPAVDSGEIPVDDAWQWVSFQKAFEDPIVVATPASEDSGDLGVIRIEGIQPNGFWIRLQKWQYLGGAHRQERVGYFAIERGSHVLPSGARVEAGRLTIDPAKAPPSRQFANPFPSVPVVFTSVTSDNGRDAVITQLRNVTSQEFTTGLTAQESTARANAAETVDYIAWEINNTASAPPDGCSLSPGRFEPGAVGSGSLDACNPVASAYWGLDESNGQWALDSAGSNQLKLWGQAAWAPNGGKAGGALRLPGDGAFAEISDASLGSDIPAHSSGGSQSFTLMAWIRPESVAGRNPILSKQGTEASGATRGFMLSAGNDDDQGRLYFELFNGDNDDNKTIVESSGPLTPGQWQHVAATYQFKGDGTSEAALFINGRKVGETKSAVGPVQANHQPLSLGRYFWSSGNEWYFNGLIDEVRILPIALQPESSTTASGIIRGRNYEVGVRSGVTDRPHQIHFQNQFRDGPAFIAQIQTFREKDPATLRWRAKDGSSVRVRIAEEQSLDSETIHKAEDVGYLLIGD